MLSHHLSARVAQSGLVYDMIIGCIDLSTKPEFINIIKRRFDKEKNGFHLYHWLADVSTKKTSSPSSQAALRKRFHAYTFSPDITAPEIEPLVEDMYGVWRLIDQNADSDITIFYELVLGLMVLTGHTCSLCMSAQVKLALIEHEKKMGTPTGEELHVFIDNIVERMHQNQGTSAYDLVRGPMAAAVPKPLPGGGSSEAELQSALHSAAKADREGKRVAYGDFVECMSQTEKAAYSPGQAVFRQGDKPDGFFLLLSGEVRVEVAEQGGGPPKKLATLKAGEFFGETALLSDAPRNATVVCATPATTLRLSREDFEAGFLGGGGGGSAASAARQTLAFIQMVSRMKHDTARRGEAVFLEGDVGDRFYIVEEGKVHVEARGKDVASLGPGACFGETALLTQAPRNATVRCASEACKFVSLDGAEFLYLMKRSSALQRSLIDVAAGRSGVARDAFAKEVVGGGGA